MSGVATPTSLYITGTQGISSLRPGNITGVPSLAAGAGAGGGGLGLTIQVGSGADTAGGPTNNIANGGATNNVVGRSTVADPTANPAITTIGGALSGSSSPVLPPGQTYRDSTSCRVQFAEHGAAVGDGGPRHELRSVRSQPASGCSNLGSVQYEPVRGDGQPHSRVAGAVRSHDAEQ